MRRVNKSLLLYPVSNHIHNLLVDLLLDVRMYSQVVDQKADGRRRRLVSGQEEEKTLTDHLIMCQS